MTIQYPDVAHYQAGLRIQPGTPVVIAKVTQGTWSIDSEYPNFKAQAASVGAVFAGYHWLEHGNVNSQAAFCFAHNGTAPLMIDAEEISGSSVTVADITGFIDAYRALGGIVHLLYLPHWYWANNMGSPGLAPCVARDVHLVVSEYRTYSDTAWPAAYGGMTPEVWQFTDAHAYGGQNVDFNAFRGTVGQFAQLIGGSSMLSVNEIDVVNAIVYGSTLEHGFLPNPDAPGAKATHDVLSIAGVQAALTAQNSVLSAIKAAVTTPAPVVLTDAQIAALAAQVAASHPKLSAGDEPAIVDALKTFFGPAVSA